METQEGFKIDVTKTFKRILLDKNLKQYEVAENSGMDKRPYNRLLQKNDDLRIREIIKIADTLNCDVKLSFTDRESDKQWECDLSDKI